MAFELKIRQEPTRAKSCGFSTSVLSSLTSPSLIVELVLKLPRCNTTCNSVDTLLQETSIINTSSVTSLPYIPDLNLNSGNPSTRETSIGNYSIKDAHSANISAENSLAVPSNFSATEFSSVYMESHYTKELAAQNYVGVVTLVDTQSLEPRTVILKDSNEQNAIPMDILVGTRSSTPQHLCDPEDNNIEKLFFIFGDLSVRIPGSFRLRIDCVNVQKYHVIN